MSKQYTTPVVVIDDKATVLRPISLDEGIHDEAWFQDKLFRHPTLLPIIDIEPGFAQLISVARELPTDHGPLDILFADADGHLILIETKLWRNPEARRKVVGQIVDYATVISKWSYDDLVAAVKSASKSTEDDPLLSLVRNQVGPEFDESRFVDAVSLNLSRGRFLLLIVGDGIHEGIEQMAAFLDQYPQLGFRLALVEVGLYRLGTEKDIFVQPRVIAATREIVRAIVEIAPGADRRTVVVKPAPFTDAAMRAGFTSDRSSMSEEDFYVKLKEIKPELAVLVSQTIREAPSHGLTVQWKRNGPILRYVNRDYGDYLNFGQLSPSGTLSSTMWFSAKSIRLGFPQSVWKPYYESLKELVPGTVITEREEKGTVGKFWELTDSAGREIQLEHLLRRKEEWFVTIDSAVKRSEYEMAKLSEHR